MNNTKQILCTLGPASLNEKVIKRLDEIGVNVFRINLSHTPLSELESVIQQIQRHTNKPICLDTEGAQIRTGTMEKREVVLSDNSVLDITGDPVLGNGSLLPFTPSFVMEQLRVGDLISIDFDSVLIKVISLDKKRARARVICGGSVGSNKAVSLDRPIDLPAMSAKDRKAIAIGRKYGIRHFALSFASSRRVVVEFRKAIGKNRFLISKIESRKALQNLDEICEASDAILIDRGDLSREEPLDKIPLIQKLIIKKAKEHKIPVYVATNLLESMVKNKKPTRAEVNDIMNTLLDGASGLVLAAETAIGAYPVNCAEMVSRMIKHSYEIDRGISLEDFHRTEHFLVIEPHGGSLVNRMAESLGGLPQGRFKKLFVNTRAIIDAEQIALGALSPLEGFMTKRELESVLRNYHLPNRVVWPLPITLRVDKERAAALREGEKVVLVHKDTRIEHAWLDIEEIYHHDLGRIATEIFGTRDKAHPAVASLFQEGDCFLAGRVTLLRRFDSPLKHYELTPRQTRLIFETKGWSKIAGFHARSVVDRVHERIPSLVINDYHCDGMLIHPMVDQGERGEGRLSEISMKSYEWMVEKYYPKGRTLLAAFQNYPRSAGPREVVFTALCRKNFGCNHFVLNSEDVFSENHHAPDAARRLFEHLKSGLGIQLITQDIGKRNKVLLA